MHCEVSSTIQLSISVDNICGLDVIGMKLISNYNKITRFPLCVTDMKYQKAKTFNLAKINGKLLKGLRIRRFIRILEKNYICEFYW